MISLSLRGAADTRPVRKVLCLGAHSDDIEIGCGGAVLRLTEAFPDAAIRWVVLSGNAQRAAEARCGAALFLAAARRSEVVIKSFRDGHFPYEGREIKEYLESLKEEPTWDLIFTHHRADLHQDHRTVSELSWNAFRNHMILEYEIPKYDGGLGDPNCFVPLDDETRHRKVDRLMQAFSSQRDKHWFTPETFHGLMRLRGIESASPTGHAEAFHGRKLSLAL